MSETAEIQWFRALRMVLDDAHLWRPPEVADRIAAALGPLGLDITVWLVDYEQAVLRVLPRSGRPDPAPLPVDGSLAGRAFARVASLRGEGGRWWVPLLDGTDRLGVAEIVATGSGSADVGGASGERDFLSLCELFTGLVAHLIVSTSHRGDHFERIRRSRPMSPASEMLWKLLPPQTGACDRAVISAVLQPCYEVGGDGFDYALDGDVAYLLILDAVGKGVSAGVACAVALSAIRTARAAVRGLYDQARAADVALQEQFPESRFVTGFLAELRLDTGRLRYVNAGHPRPLLLRGGRLVREIAGGNRLPLGLDDPHLLVGEEFLEPEDRLLLYTDGVTEARTPNGERFGVTRLVDFVERHVAAGLPTPETLRRLAHAVMEHQGGPPDDDASLLMVQWSSAAARNVVTKAEQPTEENESPR